MLRVRKEGKISIHGHRGSRGTLPENCLPSFEEAWKAKADFFELDVHLSKDDVPIVFHDPVITRRVCVDAEKPVTVRSLPAAAIVGFDCGSVPQPNFPKQKLLPGTKISTLESVLKWVASEATGIGVNIEIKLEAVRPEELPSPEGISRRVLEVVDKYHLEDRVILQSFDFRPLGEIRRLKPDMAMSCLFERATDFVAEAKKVGANIIGPFFQLLDASIVKKAHAAGIEVLPWTVNEPADWRKVLDLGVDGIITDYPRTLYEEMKKNG